MFSGCSNQLSHRDSSIEYLQHMLWLKNETAIIMLHPLYSMPLDESLHID